MKIETPPLEELMQQWEKDSEVDTTEPGKERNTTVKDARGLGLLPSVTTIIGCD